MKSWCDDLGEGNCVAFGLNCFACHVFPCKTLMTAKDVLLLPRYSTSPLLLGQNLNSKLLLIKKHTQVRNFSEFIKKRYWDFNVFMTRK